MHIMILRLVKKENIIDKEYISILIKKFYFKISTKIVFVYRLKKDEKSPKYLKK